MKDIQVERILEEIKRGLTVMRQNRRLNGADEVATADMIEGLETVLVHWQAQSDAPKNRVVIIVEGGVIQEVFADRPNLLDVIRVDHDDDAEEPILVNDSQATPFSKLDPEEWALIQGAR